VVIFDSGLHTLSDEEESAAPRCGSIWVQQGARAPGRAERGDHLGTQVAITVSGDLMITAPDEDLTQNAVDAGVISFLSTEGHDYIRPRVDQTFSGGQHAKPPVRDTRQLIRHGSRGHRVDGGLSARCG
jgi:hypothetical protein